MRDFFLNCERHVHMLNKHKCNAVKGEAVCQENENFEPLIVQKQCGF